MDIFNNLVRVGLLAPAALINDTDTNSKILDRRGFNRAAIMVYVGDLTGVDADSTLELFLQESDTTVGTDFTAVPVASMIRDVTGLSSETTAGLFATINATTEDLAIFLAEYRGSKRYIRIKADFTTGTGGITVSYIVAIGLLASAQNAPGTAPAAITAG